MKKIIDSNYDSILKRGLISPSTKYKDFLKKIDEEVKEFKEATEEFIKRPTTRNSRLMDEELADIVLTCLNIAKHYKIDIEKEMIKKINKNYERATKTK